MKIISTKIHGILDYVMGAALLLMPMVLGFGHSGIESTILYSSGALMLLTALVTRYEFGIFKVMPVPLHLTVDIIAGGFLAMAPSLLGLSDKVALLFMLLGIFEVVVSFFTSTATSKAYGSSA